VHTSKLTSLFPQEYTPTKKQIDLLNKIESGLSKSKFVICSAPTGSGKSLIARTLANLSHSPSPTTTKLINSYEAFKQDFTGNYTYSDECKEEHPHGAFALTITKNLQDQYLSLFTEADILKGKSNYICEIDENYKVDFAPCTFVPKLKEQCWDKNICPYYTSRNKALLSRFAALNYKMFLALPEHVKRKNIIICDEASELEEELIRQFSAEITYDKLKQSEINMRTLVSDNNERARSWVYELIEKVSTAIDTITSIGAKKLEMLSKHDIGKYQYLKALQNSLTMIDNMWENCEYIIDVSATKVSFTPLHANLLSKHIFDYGDKIVLMSATFIDHKHYAKSLGITDYTYVECESDFDPSKSPIYVSSTNRINYKNLKTVLPKVCEQINQIAQHHKNDKGIIHTHTQEITNIIQTKLAKNKRYLFRDSSATNENILKEHYETQDPTILVSPSLVYGVDLKDELARFQIIVKLPFLPLSSKRIKRLFEMDPDWYENKMLSAVVQASGRATRNINDFSVTYILDSNIINVIKRSKHKFPKHFIDRIQ